MSTVPSYFKDFLSNIRLSDNQISDLKTGHTTLRKRLEADETLSKIIVRYETSKELSARTFHWRLLSGRHSQYC